MDANRPALEQRLTRLLNYCALDPNNLKLLRECADVEYRLGNFAAARIRIESALERFPGDSLLLFQLATVEMASDNTERACHLLQTLLVSGIDNGGVRYNLAYALGLRGEAQQALQVLDERWAAVCAEVPVAPVLKAKLQHHQSQIEEAIATLTQYVGAAPEDIDANGYLALLLTDEGEYAAATICAERALAGNGEHYEALLAQGMVALSEGDPLRAKHHFEKTAYRREETGRSWLGLGLSEMTLGKLAEGEAALARAVQYMPRHLGSWNALAWAQIGQNKLDEAEVTLKHALEVDRTFAETHGSLATVHILQGDIEAGRAAARRAERLNPQSFAAAFANSLLLMDKGDRAAATALVQDILQRPIDRHGKNLVNALRELRTSGMDPTVRIEF